MKLAVALFAVSLSTLNAKAPTVHTQKFKLFSKEGDGPITGSMQIVVKGKTAYVSVSARNESGVPIHYLSFCVRPGAVSKGPQVACAFNLWTTAPVWNPNSDAPPWDISGPTAKGIEAADLIISRLVKQTPIHTLRRVFVQPIDGNNGEMAREQVIALLTNSGRFEVVEDQTSAEAVLKGRSEIRDAGVVTQGRAVSRGGAIGSGGIVASVTAMGASNSTNVTENVISEGLILRLVTYPSGQTLWAWDDTRSCAHKEACAIDDLVSTAR